MHPPARYYSGLSGLQLPVPKHLYPPSFENASRLTYYSSLFNSIEINSSFYKIPQKATVTKWENTVTENFHFTFKLWKGITHTKGLDFNKEDVTTFFNSINTNQAKKGCILIQFPPSLDRENFYQLELLLSVINTINKPKPWNIALEFRNKSWYSKSIYDIINSYNAAVVIHDIPKSSTPYLNHLSNFIYVRFHGPTGKYRDSYSIDFLNEYAIYICEWLSEGKDVFVYFNNTMGDAYQNLKTLNSLIRNKLNPQ